MSFPAKYPGVCNDCGEHVSVGELINYVSGSLTHESCGGSSLDLRVNAEVCTECWLVKPCECEG